MCWQDQNDNSIRFKKGNVNIISSTESDLNKSIKLLTIKQGLQINSEQEIDVCSIYNLEGRLIHESKQFRIVEIPLPISGIYLIKIKQGKEEYSLKWMRT